MQPRRFSGARNAAALGLAGVSIGIEMWSVVPAPHLLLLPLAVAVPELAAFTLPACALAAFAAWMLARGPARAPAVGLCIVAACCAALPLAELPATRSAAERSFAAADWSGHDGGGRLAAPDVGRQPPSGEVRLTRGLPVVTRDGAHLALDLYRPAAEGTHPAVIVIYGGAWSFGDRAQTARSDRALASRGYAVVAIDYRHAPAYRFPTQLNDVRDALATVARNAAAWDIDPTRVALFGRSAGGELALLAAYEPGPLHVRAAVAYYAPTDLLQGYRWPPQPDPADVRGILRAYLGGTPDEKAAAYFAASPVRHVRAGLPPTLLVSGARDELVRLSFAHELRDAIRTQGGSVVAIDLPWANHAFDAVPGGLGERLARAYTERFLAATLHARR